MFAVARFQRLAVSKFAGISKKSLSTIKFSQSHEYIKVTNTSLLHNISQSLISASQQVVGDIGTVGITQHAADALGDVVYVELPAKGTQYTAGSSFGSVESVKAASDVYAPVSGEVIEVNEVRS